jgi:hypothetical protein
MEYIHTHIHKYIHTYLPTYIHTYIQQSRKVLSGDELESSVALWNGCMVCLVVFAHPPLPASRILNHGIENPTKYVL